MPTDRPGGAHPLAAGFREQARIARASRLSASLLRAMAGDLDGDGPTAWIMSEHESEPPDGLGGLRLLAGLHRLVLENRAEQLAPYFPTAGGTAPVHEAWPAARRVLESDGEELARLVRRPLPANEPGRCALLHAGLVLLGQRFSRPIRLLEIGSGAGFGLRVDSYAYVVRDRVLGDATAEVRVVEPWRLPPLHQPDDGYLIGDRRGCDPHPPDVTDAEDRLTLRSVVWGDDVARMQRLDAALRHASSAPVPIDQVPASRWLPQNIGWPRTDALSVIWHADVWPHLDQVERGEVSDEISAAGERATATAPLAVLGFEAVRAGTAANAPVRYELRLTTWPSGQVEVLAVANIDGSQAEWVGVPARPRS